MKQIKETVRIKRWQLLRYRSDSETAELSERDFVAVGKRAFAKNRYLEEVFLPSGCSAVKSHAFADCKRLKTVTLSAEVGVGISFKAFADCKRLKQVHHGESIHSIGDGAFLGCTSLEELSFGKDLRRIGTEAFRACSSLQNVCLPASLQTVGEAAFAECTELCRLELADGLTALSKGLFQNCISLQAPDFPSTLRAIPTSAFEGCSAMTELTVPGNVRKIGKYAFFACRRLREIQLEAGVQSIGAHAFDATPRLQRVRVPNSVRHIGQGAFGFGFCKPDEKIILEAETEYMVRRLKRLLFWCGSLGRVRVVMVGETVEERKRARRRTELEQKPVHLTETFPAEDEVSREEPLSNEETPLQQETFEEGETCAERTEPLAQEMGETPAPEVQDAPDVPATDAPTESPQTEFSRNEQTAEETMEASGKGTKMELERMQETKEPAVSPKKRSTARKKGSKGQQ